MLGIRLQDLATLLRMKERTHEFRLTDRWLLAPLLIRREHGGGDVFLRQMGSLAFQGRVSCCRPKSRLDQELSLA